MKWKLAATVAACLFLSSDPAWAHRIDEYLQATILSLDSGRVHASMRLIPGIQAAPSVIAAIDTNQDVVFSEGETRAYADRVLADLSITVDGQPVTPQLDAWVVPDASQLRDGLGEIHLDYHVDLPPAKGSSRSLVLSNHHLNATSVYLMNVEVPEDHNLRIVDQIRDQRQTTFELDYEQLREAASPLGSRIGLRAWWNGLQFASLFRLGMHHIAEGTDHLLFLLVLLLPAPLLAVGRGWGPPSSVHRSLLHIVGIVTAFTLGHSLTLALAAMNVIRVPGRPVEILIAVSILVSAIHALRPIFPGREAWIAAFFGLIHGLAFATTLDRLGLSRWDRVAGILTFKLGIETMQMLVVVLILPSLLLISRTRAYPILRIGGAVSACAASAMWIAERTLNVQMPVDGALNLIARRGVLCAGVLFAVSSSCWFFDKRPGPSRVESQ